MTPRGMPTPAPIVMSLLEELTSLDALDSLGVVNVGLRVGEMLVARVVDVVMELGVGDTDDVD